MEKDRKEDHQRDAILGRMLNTPPAPRPQPAPITRRKKKSRK